MLGDFMCLFKIVAKIFKCYCHVFVTRWSVLDVYLNQGGLEIVLIAGDLAYLVPIRPQADRMNCLASIN